MVEALSVEPPDITSDVAALEGLDNELPVLAAKDPDGEDVIECDDGLFEGCVSFICEEAPSNNDIKLDAVVISSEFEFLVVGADVSVRDDSVPWAEVVSVDGPFREFANTVPVDFASDEPVIAVDVGFEKAEPR